MEPAMKTGSGRRGYRFRVFLFAGLMVFLVVTSLAFTFGVVWYSKRVSSQIVERDFKARQTERAMIDLLLSMDRNRKKFLLLGKERYRGAFYDEVLRFRQELRRLEEIGLSEAERGVLSRLEERLDDYLRRRGLFEPGEEGLSATGVSDLPLEEVHRLLRLNQDRMDRRIEQMNRLEEKTLQAGLLWGILSLMAAGGLSLLLIRSITRPIDLLRQGTREIAEGKFDHRVELETRDELGELASSFNEMADQLKRLDEMKADFIAVVSHELKTPLTSMKEAVNLLLEEAVGPVNPKQRHLLEINAAGIDRLSGFVEDILNLTRMEGGLTTLYCRRFDLQGLLRECLEAFRLLADRKGIALSAVFVPDPLPDAYGDAERLRQVFSNLIHNAIFFTPAGGRVSLRVEALGGAALRRRAAREELGREGFLVSVSDTGEGIPREEWKRVFDKFYQIRKASKRGSGSGLGLTIARHIVEAHGGAIWVEASSEKGSTICLALPRGDAPSKRPVEPERRSRGEEESWAAC